MAAITRTAPGTTVDNLVARSPEASERPAVTAAARVARAGMALSGLGLAASMLAIVRLFETWRIGPRVPAHSVSVLGLHMSYPAANAEALIVLLLAFVGFVVAARIVAGSLREVLVARRVARKLVPARPIRSGDAFVIEDAAPRAFCAGLLRPRVYVSSGALGLLDDQALEAVLLHERHHADRRDPLRLAAGRVLARALFFLPWLAALHRHERALAELGADERALRAAPENRSALARARCSTSATPAAGHRWSIQCASTTWSESLRSGASRPCCASRR